ncbi:sensor domain-containing diguanylate cyclase [Aeromonas sobria]|uniref:sensor domain-containing diguanylate cyclase n=1 Tax=Aeromonas sobria TaxID=646 RepID=UPI003CFF8412
MNNIISKDLHCNTQLNITFGVIVLTLLIALLGVSYSIQNSAEKKYHQVAAMFVHNMATQFIEQQFKPLEHALSETGHFVNEQNLQAFLTDPHSPLRLDLMQTLSLTPNVVSIAAADLQGHFNSVPHLPAGSDLDARQSPWFKPSASRNLFVSYTAHYPSLFSDHHTVSISQPILDREGFPLGTLAMDLNLEHLSYPLRQLKSPVRGEFHLVDRAGDTLLHSDVGNLFKRHVEPSLIKQMTNGAGHLFDAERQAHVYYYSFSNPDWFAIYTVSDDEFKQASHSESRQLLVAMAGCLLICLLCWGSLRHALNRMIVEIVATLRVGRIDLSKPGNLLRQEIDSGHRQMQEAVTASTTDALTGLFNRRSFDQDLAMNLADGRPFFLGMVDLDNFKSINDRLGHVMGDTVLQAVAQEGLNAAGERARLYRYGGEELAILIPGDDTKEAMALLDGWRLRVGARQWRESDLVVTFSAGLGPWRQESAEQLIERVDQALYQAKHTGKNRVLHAN